jgi:hypothetical protein
VKANPLFATLLVSVIALSNLSASAAPSPKSGASCAKVGVGKTQTYKGLKYTCIKSGKKLVWSKGVPPASRQPTSDPSPSPTISATLSPAPTPISTPSASPTPTPTPTPTQSQRPLSISERWSEIDQTALKIFNDWAAKELPKNHSVKIEYVSSDKADKEAIEEIKKRYELAARFWAPYSTVTKEFKVLIANHNEAKWICDIKRSWLQISQPDCEEVESNGRSDIPTAGQSQVRNRNVDMYQVKNRLEMDTLFFVGRIEHEFTHNIFYEQSDQYQNFMPCWQIEGGAEFFGILIANRNDVNAYIQARNIKFETDFLNLKELSWSLEDWVNFLNEIDRTDVPNRQGDTCGPVRPKIYHHSVLANEYLVSKVGIPGYLKLIRDASVTSWSETIKRTFGMEKKDFYREMATYMMMQYRLARENSWSYYELRKIPFGR